MNLKISFFLIFCIITTKLVSQTYAANNFTLISNISPETVVNSYGCKYSGCWGWYQSSLNKEYAIACSTTGTYWVDVTNPSTPTVSAYSAGTSSVGVWREVKTYQNYCYVICDDNSSFGFQIFDMSNLPTSVTKVYEGKSYFRKAHALWVDGNKLYVSGITYSNSTSSSMNVYSLATPSVPVLLRSLKQDAPFISYVHDMMPVNDTVFASCGNQGLYVFKYNPGPNTFTQLGSLTSYTASGFNHSTALTPNRKTLIMTDEVPISLPIKVLNVQNLSNIQVLATTNQFIKTTPHNPFMVSNNLCFMSSYQDGLQLYNISNPSAPVLAGYFDTYYQGGGNNNNWTGDDYDGQWGSYPYFPSKNIFALDQNNGLFMLKTHLYQNPSSSFNFSNNICASSAVNVVNTSTSATSYNWTFTGGSPATSTLTNPTVTYNTAGIYTISLTTSNNSTTTASSSQTINVGIASVINFTNPTCGVCNNGIVTITPTSGTGPYSYTWAPTGGNTATESGLGVGCYTVTLMDASSCTSNTTICISLVTKLQASSFNSTNVLVYPNPAQNTINIEYLGANFDYKIYNNLGQIMVIDKNIKNKIAVNLNEFNKGIYFVEVQIGKDLVRKKLIIN